MEYKTITGATTEKFNDGNATKAKIMHKMDNVDDVDDDGVGIDEIDGGGDLGSDGEQPDGDAREDTRQR